IKTPPYLAWRWVPHRADQVEDLAARISSVLGWPVVVKPSREGSTVGVSIVREPGSLAAALEEAARYDRDLLLERYIPGKEITVAVLGNDDPQPLPIIEIVPKKAFYDFEAKYTPGMSEHVIPARIPPSQARRAEDLALRAYRALGCRGFARVDMIALPDEEEPYVLEVNTLPGMTATSLVPDAARAAGLEFPALVEKLLDLALHP
ncbi:MAG: ATP-grasp domain-containing protein, partial [Bacillota bacterium]|nr:ATP-grasp domain-containing protein [Bacillota bacterium]